MTRPKPPAPCTEDRCEAEEHARRLAPPPPTLRTLNAAAAMFDAAGNVRRLRLLILLRERAHNVAEIAEAVSQAPSLVSHQLGVLRAARLVRGLRDGRFVRYELFDEHARHFVDAALAHTARVGQSAGRR